MSYTNFICHIVFGTKRHERIINANRRHELYAGGTVHQLGRIAFASNGGDDHVHLLIKLKPTVLFSDLMRDLKANSSKWAKVHGIKQFAGQRRYGAFPQAYQACGARGTRAGP